RSRPSSSAGQSTSLVMKGSPVRIRPRALATLAASRGLTSARSAVGLALAFSSPVRRPLAGRPRIPLPGTVRVRELAARRPQLLVEPGDLLGEDLALIGEPRGGDREVQQKHERGADRED